jgi:hypothetical protein
MLYSRDAHRHHTIARPGDGMRAHFVRRFAACRQAACTGGRGPSIERERCRMQNRGSNMLNAHDAMRRGSRRRPRKRSRRGPGLRRRLFSCALARDAHLLLPTPPHGPGAATMRTHILLGLRILGWRHEPFSEGHIILISTPGPISPWPIPGRRRAAQRFCVRGRPAFPRSRSPLRAGFNAPTASRTARRQRPPPPPGGRPPC